MAIRRSFAHPYTIVCLTYTKDNRVVSETPISSSKCLGCAIERAHQTECAWLRLVGAQWQPLSWIVVDIRDYARHNPWKAKNKGVQHDCRKNAHRAPNC